MGDLLHMTIMPCPDEVAGSLADMLRSTGSYASRAFEGASEPDPSLLYDYVLTGNFAYTAHGLCHEVRVFGPATIGEQGRDGDTITWECTRETWLEWWDDDRSRGLGPIAAAGEVDHG